MPYKEKVGKICPKCKRIFKTRSNKKQLCDYCQEVKNKELHNKANKRYEAKNNRPSRQNKKLCICRECKKESIHRGHGLCHNCYEKWRYLNNKLKRMSESEKESYLRSRGLLDNKKDFSVDNLKKDLGFEG